MVQFNQLEDYTNELQRSNLGSTIKLLCDEDHENSSRKFQRFYVCLKALKDGFKKCRPIIGINGCFLKGMTKGQLLTAIDKDGNNSMYLIVFAVVEL